MFFPFASSSRSRAQAAWFCAGPATSFPDIQPPDGDADADTVARAVLSTLRPCGSTTDNGTNSYMPGCKVFHVTEDTASGRTDAREVALDAVDLAEHAAALKDEVLVFRYKGRFIAVDHKCPHMSYPLSAATPFDIEDFGIVLSAGLTCPKHGWSFDIFTGMGDRGNYRLRVWEVELRDQPVAVANNRHDTSDVNATNPELDATLSLKDVWVRKRQRIG